MLHRVDLLQFSALKTFEPRPATPWPAARWSRVGTRGKYLVFELDGPRLLVHLSQGGRVDVESPPKTTKPRGAVVPAALRRPPVGPDQGVRHAAQGRHLGAAPGRRRTAREARPRGRLRRGGGVAPHGDDNRRVHTILRDQRTLAGVGRGYSDDALHRAKLSPVRLAREARRRRARPPPRRPCDESSPTPSRSNATGPAGCRRSSATTSPCTTATATPCPVCGDDLRRVSYESHEVTYCPTCQTGGKRLNDRRIDRLVR